MSGFISSFENKTVVVTGASGFIGSSLIISILEGSENSTVLAYGRSLEKLESTFSNYINDSRLLLTQHDFSESAFVALEFVGKIDYIFHAASPQDRHTVRNNPLQVIKSNILGLQNCIEYLANQSRTHQKVGRLIVFSSLTVYGTAESGEVISLKENDSNRAASLHEISACYSESKRMCEVIASAAHRTMGLDVVICRFSTVFGRPLNPTNTAFSEFLELASKGLPISVEKRYGPKRDNIYIKDAIYGLLCASAYGKSGASYNISSNGMLGNFLSVGEIAIAIAHHANRILHGSDRVVVRFGNEAFESDSGILLDHSSLRELGWSLSYSFEKALTDTLS